MEEYVPKIDLCEGNCVIERAGHGTVTIGSIEKFITDTAFENGWVKPIKVKKSLGSQYWNNWSGARRSCGCRTT